MASFSDPLSLLLANQVVSNQNAGNAIVKTEAEKEMQNIFSDNSYKGRKFQTTTRFIRQL